MKLHKQYVLKLNHGRMLKRLCEIRGWYEWHMIKHRVEIFEDNHWKIKSRHMKEEDAVFKAYAVFQRRKIDTRVVHKGKIIVAYYAGKKEK